MTSTFVVNECSLCNRAPYFAASSGTSVAGGVEMLLVSNDLEIDLTYVIQVCVDEF